MNDTKFTMNALILVAIIFTAIGFFFTVKLGKLADDPGLREEMGRNARRCAEEKFDRARTYRKLAEVILNGSED